MADIGLQLMIKYGLDGEPDQTKVSEWVAKVDKYTSLGYPDEQAGNIAAKAVFPDYKIRRKWLRDNRMKFEI